MNTKAVVKSIRSFKPSVLKPVKQLHFRGEGAKYIGFEEPTWPDENTQYEWTNDEYQMHIASALNWYTNSLQDDKVAQNLAMDALALSNHFPELLVTLENSTLKLPKTYAWLIRMAHNGMVLRFRSRRQIVREIKKLISAQKVIEIPSKDSPAKPNIQDHIAAKIRYVKGLIDFEFDKFVMGDCKGKFETVIAELLNVAENTIPVNRTGELVSYLEKYLSEVRPAFEERLPYVDFYPQGKRKLKAMVLWLEQAIADVTFYGQQKKSTQKTRAKKAKTPNQLIGKLKFMEKCPELKIESIDPTQVLKANELWVYNVRLRKLGHYVSLNGLPFQVKGTRLVNLDPSKSVQKTLRKPAEQLKELSNYSKPGAIKWFNNIKAVGTKLRDAINKDSILLKIVK